MTHIVSRSRRRRLSVLVTACCLAVIGAGGVMLAEAANAALVEVPSMGDAGGVVLSSAKYPTPVPDLIPGTPAFWQVGVRLEDVSWATLSLEIRKSGELVTHPRGLTMTIRLCDAPWTALDATPACDRGERHVTVVTPEDDHTVASPTFELRPITPSTPAFLLVTLALEDSAEARADRTLMGLSGEMGLGLTATALDGMPVAPEGPSLPATGVNLSALLGVLAIAAGGLGVGVALRFGRGGGRA